MLRFLKSFFSKQTQPEPEVPYKVEPAAHESVAQPQCGCGRSASGFCVGLHKLSTEEWAVHPDNLAKIEPKSAPAKKPATKKSAAAKKPAAITAAPKPKTKGKKPAK